jgi:hypothetical protein
MVIGFLLALVFFGSLSYFLTRGVISHAHQSGRPFLGAFFLFLALLGGLSLLSFASMAVASMLGFSLTLGLEAIVSGFTNAQPGVVTAIGTVLIFIFNLVSVFIGPAGAFVTAKIMGVIALIAGAAKIDEKLSVTYMPLVAVFVTTWCMWPFTACLTFGL